MCPRDLSRAEGASIQAWYDAASAHQRAVLGEPLAQVQNTIAAQERPIPEEAQEQATEDPKPTEAGMDQLICFSNDKLDKQLGLADRQLQLTEKLKAQKEGFTCSVDKAYSNNIPQLINCSGNCNQPWEPAKFHEADLEEFKAGRMRTLYCKACVQAKWQE